MKPEAERTHLNICRLCSRNAYSVAQMTSPDKWSRGLLGIPRTARHERGLRGGRSRSGALLRGSERPCLSVVDQTSESNDKTTDRQQQRVERRTEILRQIYEILRILSERSFDDPGPILRSRHILPLVRWPDPVARKTRPLHVKQILDGSTVRVV